MEIGYIDIPVQDYLFSGVYGMAWFIGSTTIGALFNVSLTDVMVFAMIAELAAIPLISVVRRLIMDEATTIAVPQNE
jgi:hypothetical protein